jgi:hypothetical protein
MDPVLLQTIWGAVSSGMALDMPSVAKYATFVVGLWVLLAISRDILSRVAMAGAYILAFSVCICAVVALAVAVVHLLETHRSNPAAAFFLSFIEPASATHG